MTPTLALWCRSAADRHQSRLENTRAVVAILRRIAYEVAELARARRISDLDQASVAWNAERHDRSETDQDPW